MEALLLNAVTAEEEAARLCAAQWAQRLFAFDHVPARYVCIMAAGDNKLEVREAGLAGLKPPRAQPGMSGSGMSNSYILFGQKAKLHGKLTTEDG